MSVLSTFQFNTSPINVLTIKGEPWFINKEVATVLDYADPSMLLKHVDDEDKQVINPQSYDSVEMTETFGSNTFRLSVINESGLYAAVFSSTKKEAKVFKRWVTSEVLPSIRKTGSYSIKPMTPAEQLLASVQLTVEHERKLAEQQRQLEEQNSRLITIEDRFAKVDEELKSLPPCTEEVAPKSIRSAINEVLRSYAYTTGESHNTLWRTLYKEYRYRYHVDLVRRARNENKKPLVYAEETGLIDNLYAVAITLFTNELEVI